MGTDAFVLYSVHCCRIDEKSLADSTSVEKDSGSHIQTHTANEGYVYGLTG